MIGSLKSVAEDGDFGQHQIDVSLTRFAAQFDAAVDLRCHLRTLNTDRMEENDPAMGLQDSRLNRQDSFAGGDSLQWLVQGAELERREFQKGWYCLGVLVRQMDESAGRRRQIPLLLERDGEKDPAIGLRRLQFSPPAGDLFHSLPFAGVLGSATLVVQ